MKKLLTLLLLTGTLACNNHNPSENKETINTSEVDHHEQAVNTGDLLLNNGAKWKADSITNNNLKNLLAIIEAFNSGVHKSLAAYKKATDDLQHGLDKMISECKMQGPDHNALHKWLEPVIEQVSQLKQATTEAAAAKLFEAIHTQVKLYSQYFE